MLSKVFTALVIVIFVREGKCQCYTDTACSGSIVDGVSDDHTCCVDTNDGLSFHDGTSCKVCIVHGFVKAVYDVVENTRLDTEFRLNVKGTTTSPIVLSGTINAAAAGTAENSDFQQLAPITVSGTTPIRVFALNDATTLEYDDKISLTFTPGNTGLIPGVEGLGEFIRQEAIINIIDNDMLLINFKETDLTISEGSNMLSTPMRLQFRLNQNPFTVTLSPVNISRAEALGVGDFFDSDMIGNDFRATAGADFTEDITTITVPANSRFYDIDAFFNITADNIDEDEQSFAVVAEIGQDVPHNVSCFQIVDGDPGCTTERLGATRIRITDIDRMVIGFTTRSTTVNEGTAPLGFDVFRVGVDLDTLITAERVHDMTIRLQETISNATILSSQENTDNITYDAIFGSRFEDDEPIIQEYMLNPGEDSFDPLEVLIRNDFSPEGFECFTIRITPDDVPGRRELFSCYEDKDNATSNFCEHTICIIDDDDPFEVAFVETIYTVPESVGSVEICVNLTQAPADILDETVNVFVIDFPASNYAPADCPPAVPDEPDFLSRYLMQGVTDFAAQIPAVNEIDDILITQTMRIICYNQLIYNDSRLEPDEYLGLILGVEMNDFTTVRTSVKPMYNQSAIKIIDDDRAVVGLEETFYSMTEGEGTVEVCAVVHSPDIDCPIEFPFTVSLSTMNNTAVSPMDYEELTNHMFNFPACERKLCTNITIVDDCVLENDESFFLTLERESGLDSRITLDPVAGTVVISDNEIGEIGLEMTCYSVEEGESVDVCTIVSSPSGAGCTITTQFSVPFVTTDNTAMAGMDYTDSDTTITFAPSETRKCVSVQILTDSQQEGEEIVDISLGTPSMSRITVTQPQSQIKIGDIPPDPDGVTLRNDTVTGDPLMTVPIFTTPNESILCYEVHGEANKHFNLISDSCVSVNAHYARAVMNNPNINLNVINTIGIRAVNNINTCINIAIDLQGCSATVNGQSVTMYNSQGIMVRKYTNRVRITVPNCADTQLVMWVFCSSGVTEDPSTQAPFPFSFIRFVVMRGFNLAETSHGLIGQFWNIPVEIKEFDGIFDGVQRSDDYEITVNYPESEPRSFVGLEEPVTWEFEKKSCLYVGNSQAGPLAEVDSPNDSVIEGDYIDYMVDSLHSTMFDYTHFNESRCT